MVRVGNLKSLVYKFFLINQNNPNSSNSNSNPRSNGKVQVAQYFRPLHKFLMSSSNKTQTSTRCCSSFSDFRVTSRKSLYLPRGAQRDLAQYL